MSQTDHTQDLKAAVILAVLFAAASLCVISLLPRETEAQWSAFGTTEPVESSTKPTEFQGEWVRTTDAQIFSASTTKNKWLGTEDVFHYGKNATSVTGALNMNNNVPCDTTDGAEDGYAVPDSAYVTMIRCANDPTTITACSLEVFTPSSRVYAGAWTGDTEYFYPSNLVIPAGQRIMVYIKSGATNPHRPLVDLKVRPFVSR